MEKPLQDGEILLLKILGRLVLSSQTGGPSSHPPVQGFQRLNVRVAMERSHWLNCSKQAPTKKHLQASGPQDSFKQSF